MVECSTNCSWEHVYIKCQFPKRIFCIILFHYSVRSEEEVLIKKNVKREIGNLPSKFCEIDELI